MQLEAIIPQLVFDHALRIRVKAEVSPTLSAVPTADGEATTITETARNNHGPAEAALRHAEGPTDPNSESHSTNLLGKLNNLVTTDLKNITAATDFLLIGQWT